MESHGFAPDDPNPQEKLMYPMPLKTSIKDSEGIVNPDQNFYEVKMKNNGGLVMPVILQFNYRDGSSEIKRIPAEIWRQNEEEFTKVFVLEKEVDNVVVDPQSWTMEQVSSISVALEETELPVYFSVGPNPVNETLNIYFLNPSQDQREIQLLDISGKQVFGSISKSDRVNIDMSSFNKGVYLVQVTDKNYSYLRKIIR